jgi:peptide/nickel transport system permease protein
MGRYVARRLVFSLFVVMGVVTVVFVLVRLSGDPVLLYLPEDATEEEIAHYRHEMGFDRPLFIQYADFMWNAFTHGDMGRSFRHGVPALPLVVERLPATIELATFAFLVAMVVAIPVGIISAVYRNSFLDAIARIFALLGQSLPIFWTGIVLILLFAVRFRFFPTSGRGQFKHLVLPGFALGIYSMAVTMRVLRSSMIEVLSSDYIRTARAKGLAERVVLIRHALRNASLPVITVMGLRIGYLLSGSILTESVFAYPGMGWLVVQAIYQRDFAIVQAFVIVVSTMIVSINLIVDLLYAYLDPRITYK